jgi:hypothetical protein
MQEANKLPAPTLPSGTRFEALSTLPNLDAIAIHPLADEHPWADKHEGESLQHSIKEQGILEPITLYRDLLQ